MPLEVTEMTALLNHILNNADWPNIGDAAGLLASAGDGNMYISLHTADPAGGDQTTSEAAYTSYARVAVSRAGAGWTVTAANGSNAAEVLFETATGGDEEETYFGVGFAASGAGNLLASAILGTARPVVSGVTPRFPIGELDFNVT